MLGDPKEWKQRALHCAERARIPQSPEVRQKFADLAQTWLVFAVQLEEQRALIDRWGPPKSNPRFKKATPTRSGRQELPILSRTKVGSLHGQSSESAP